MLFDPARHEALQPIPWDVAVARAAIARIVEDTEQAFDPARHWPWHPMDFEGGDPGMPVPCLYYGAAGVIWALDYLQVVGAVSASRDYRGRLASLPAENEPWIEQYGPLSRASYFVGDTPVLMLRHRHGDQAAGDALEQLIAGNIDHPSRELMWGAPGTALAALFLHERTGEARWARLFRAAMARLREHLRWSEAERCHYWIQDLYGKQSTYLDAVHGFIATGFVLIRGRHLLDDWQDWRGIIATTVERTVSRADELVNWRAFLEVPPGGSPRFLMQFCHGAPDFVVCLGDFPGTELDPLLIAAGETTWRAGPLAKGSNLCHGTGGNGYAFLALYRRTGDPQWLARARAFAMHGIAQTEADRARYGQGRYSLWTGDIGFAIYLWDCLRGEGAFPTLEVFDA
jgi:Lanthionine synthetase C-like protein